VQAQVDENSSGPSAALVKIWTPAPKKAAQTIVTQGDQMSGRNVYVPSSVPERKSGPMADMLSSRTETACLGASRQMLLLDARAGARTKAPLYFSLGS